MILATIMWGRWYAVACKIAPAFVSRPHRDHPSLGRLTNDHDDHTNKDRLSTTKLLTDEAGSYGTDEAANLIDGHNQTNEIGSSIRVRIDAKGFSEGRAVDKAAHQTIVETNEEETKTSQCRNSIEKGIAFELDRHDARLFVESIDKKFESDSRGRGTWCNLIHDSKPDGSLNDEALSMIGRTHVGRVRVVWGLGVDVWGLRTTRFSIHACAVCTCIQRPELPLYAGV